MAHLASAPAEKGIIKFKEVKAQLPSPAAKDGTIKFTEVFPIELRNMIWQATLVPRILPLRYTFCGADEKLNQDPYLERYLKYGPQSKDIKFINAAALPVALILCQESRKAVLPLYPMCFASATRTADIRFNFALDTLYFDFWTKGIAMSLFNNLTDIELSGIQRLAFESGVGLGFFGPEESHSMEKLCTRLLPTLERFTSLEKITIAYHYLEALDEFSEDSLDNLLALEVQRDWSTELDFGCGDRVIELFSTYPQALIQQYNLPADRLPPGDPQSPEVQQSQGWVQGWAKWNARIEWYLVRDLPSIYCS